jgi:hypothetical protein
MHTFSHIIQSLKQLKHLYFLAFALDHCPWVTFSPFPFYASTVTQLSTGYIDTKSILSNLVWCKFSVFLFICCQILLLQAQKYYIAFSRLSFEPLIMCQPYCVSGLHHLLFLHRNNCSHI